MSFKVFTWNVLADSYIRPSYYPRTPSSVLDPELRRARVVDRVASLDAGVICLQEVEPVLLSSLEPRLASLGFKAAFTRKSGNKPDGCATFYSSRVFDLKEARSLVYGDGSGHVAQLVSLEHEGRVVVVANTHARWDPPGTPSSTQVGLGQIRELCLDLSRSPDRSWIVCGDLNATPSSDLVRFLLEKGLFDAFSDDSFTCNSNGKRKKIDYLFHTPDLTASPDPLPSIADTTPLPSDSEPSDHLALSATFSWPLPVSARIGAGSG